MRALAITILYLLMRALATARPRLDIRPGGNDYLVRWYLTPAGKGRFARWYRRHLPGAFLHCFLASDSDRGWHSHPWHWAFSLLLRGSYLESRPQLPPPHIDYWERYDAGDVNWIRQGDFHKVKLLSHRVWTLFVVGPLHGEEWEFMAEDGTRTPHGTETPGD